MDGAGFDAALGEGLTRLEYLRLLRLGYIRNEHSDAMPLELWWELDALEEVERERAEEELRVRRAEAKRVADEIEARRRAEFEKNRAPEEALIEHWNLQRQIGKTAAAEAWATKYGQELPVIIEVAETEEEMRDAIRNLRENLAKARRGPRGGSRRGGAEKKG